MIYFIKHTDYVKIGYTNDILNRLSTLQVNCPVKLKVLGLIDGGLSDEAVYHKRFKHLSSSGEWFNYEREIEEFTDRLDKKLMWKYGFERHDKSPIGTIKSCRLEKNISLEELGELLGVSKQAVLDMQTREVQGKISLRSLSKALNAMGYNLEYRSVKSNI
jgi:hypothetical protein